MRSLLSTGALSEPIKPFERNNPADAARWLREGSQRCRGFVEDMGYDLSEIKAAKPQGKPWQGYLEEFWKDNPGYSPKTINGMRTTFSYLERIWQKKPLVGLVKRNLVEVADFLRDFVSPRNQRSLSHEAIQWQLGEVKTFLRWAVGNDYLKDDGFELVRARKKTTEER